MRILMIGLLIGAVPAVAQQKHTTGQVVGDVATQPLQDINVKNKHIPQVLELARGDPYSTTGLRTCESIKAAIGTLTAQLGPDFDSPEDRRANRVTAVGVAKGVVQGLIPFRGVIREISGAATAQRQWDAAAPDISPQRRNANGTLRSMRALQDADSCAVSRGRANVAWPASL